jgi:hypothetical protein
VAWSKPIRKTRTSGSISTISLWANASPVERTSSTRRRSKPLPNSSIRNLSIRMRTAPKPRCSPAWRRAAGIRPQSPCGYWWTADCRSRASRARSDSGCRLRGNRAAQVPHAHLNPEIVHCGRKRKKHTPPPLLAADARTRSADVRHHHAGKTGRVELRGDQVGLKSCVRWNPVGSNGLPEGISLHRVSG